MHAKWLTVARGEGGGGGGWRTFKKLFPFPVCLMIKSGFFHQKLKSLCKEIRKQIYSQLWKVERKTYKGNLREYKKFNLH